MFATYRGSRFAQIRLYMHLALPCKSADPCRVALRKGWECCALVRRQWGDAVFAEVWRSSSSDGPLHSFRRLLQEVGLEASFAAGGPTWRRKHSAYRRLDQGLEASDLAWVASLRKGLQDAVNIDVQATRALAGRLPASGLREAYQSAIIGDMVVRATTRHWQGHDGRCLCGLEAETVHHVWWRCPRYQSERQGGNRCSLEDAATPESCQGLLGVPMKLPALVQWRLEQHESL